MTWYVFYVFSTEKRVFLFGPQHEKDDGCNWCLLVAQRIDHEDSRRDEWFLIDLNTGGCKNLGRFSSCDFGFVLKAEPFGNSVS
jgi:hypothetical protein